MQNKKTSSAVVEQNELCTMFENCLFSETIETPDANMTWRQFKYSAEIRQTLYALVDSIKRTRTRLRQYRNRYLQDFRRQMALAPELVVVVRKPAMKSVRSL